MTEKDLDSMATVQIKPEYAASEVYSTTSEPPPAYKRQSSSVQIARIVAFTVIASSMIIGAFILASAYLQAKASCDQMQALDSVLEKELMLETLQQVNKEIPRAEALIGKEGNTDEADLQSIDNEEPIRKEQESKQEKDVPAPSTNENDQETDSSFSDGDEADDFQKTQMKVPLELDLSDLAAALLASNQKSRMNCVVERKHEEEIVDSPSKTMQLPFGLNLTTDPKKAKITGERISIFCETGSEQDKRTEDAEQIPPLFFPIQRFPVPFGAQPQQVPLTHMPQRMPPPPMMRQVPSPFHHMPPVPLQQMQAPRPEPPQVRIEVHRIPLTQGMIPLPIPMPNNNGMPPQGQFQKVVLQDGRMLEEQDNSEQMDEAQQKIREELLRFVAEHAFSSAQSFGSSEEEESDSSQSSQSSQSQSNEQANPQQPPQPQQTLHPPMRDQQILQIGRDTSTSGRMLLKPIPIPVLKLQSQEFSQEYAEPESRNNQMHSQEYSQEYAEPERQHVVQPRSIRDNDAPGAEKRVKRYACDCKC